MPHTEPTAQDDSYFEKGDRIIYQYVHHLNSKSSTTISKNATFIRWTKAKPFEWHPNQKAIIQVDGNKTTSTVYQSQIKHI